MLRPSVLSAILLIPRVLSSTTPTIHDLSECRFTITDAWEYDLCSIFREAPRFEIVKDDEDGIRHLYRWSSEREGNQCPEGSWICLTEGPVDRTLYPAGKAISIAQIPSRGQKNPVVFPRAPDGPIITYLHGGYHDGRQVHTRLRLQCANEEYPPELDSIDVSLNTHLFSWKTPRACPKLFRSIGLAEVETPAPGNNTSEEDLLKPTTGRLSSRRATAFIVLFSGTALLIIAYLYYNPPRTFIHTYLNPLLNSFRSHIPSHITFPTITSQSFTFRPKESKLVRWAQEDTIALEEDLMVNYEDYGEDEGVALDEYIPLRRGARASYGSTPATPTPTRAFW